MPDFIKSEMNLLEKRLSYLLENSQGLPDSFQGLTKRSQGLPMTISRVYRKEQ